MRFVELNDDNFLLFAAKKYDRTVCVGIKDFYEDLSRIKYIKRLFKRYAKSGVLSERLILNHLISLHNVFGDAVVPMLFFKIDQSMWSILKTFMVYLDYMPEDICINNHTHESDIPLDAIIIDTLRKV